MQLRSLFYFACFYFYFAVFSHHGHCRLAAIVFAAWVTVPFFAFPLLSTIFNSIHHFYCRAIFIAAIPFCRCSARQQLSQLFIQSWILLLLGCRFCSGPVIAIFILLLKDAFFVTTCHRRFFFFFLLFWLSFFSSFSHRCSYCHCSIDSNSHTIVLSKPASYSPALFSIPVKRREHAYQSFIIAYGTGKVWRLCGYSTLAVR